MYIYTYRLRCGWAHFCVCACVRVGVCVRVCEYACVHASNHCRCTLVYVHLWDARKCALVCLCIQTLLAYASLRLSRKVGQ